jgi:hypothetical protein
MEEPTDTISESLTQDRKTRMTAAEALLLSSALLVLISATGIVVTLGNAVGDWFDQSTS